MATFIATAATGLEEVAAEELAELDLAVVGYGDGAVTLDGPEFPSPASVAWLRHLNHWLRGCDRVGVLLASGRHDCLDNCATIADAVDYERTLDARRSFAVRASRRGAHDFGSMDLAAAVGEAVIEGFREQTGERLVVALGDPDVILRAEVVEDRFRLWIDATGDTPLYRREYRRQLHPASLRATMAHLMLRLAGWRGEPLLDPMTGIGTIPIEAALWGRAVPPGRFRAAPFAVDRWDRAAATREGHEAAGISAPPALLDPGAALDLLGIERYEGHVQGAWLNLAAAGNPDGVRIEQGDACALDTRLQPGAYRLAIVNPPFGRRVGSTGIVSRLYRDFARAAHASGIERIVTLAESNARMSEALGAGGFEVVGSRPVLYGDLPAFVLQAERRSAR